MGLEKHNSRLEAFCDGVFAIAITLLVLDLKVIPIGAVHSVADVWNSLGRMWPSFFALSFSFVIILISWFAHHNFLKLIDKSTPQFIFANGFYLFTVIIIPFPTAMVAEYINTPYAQPAVIVYSISSMLTNLGWMGLHWFALRPKPVIKDTVLPAVSRKSFRDSTIGFFLYGALAILAWWLPYVSFILNIITWGYWLYLSLTFKEAS